MSTPGDVPKTGIRPGFEPAKQWRQAIRQVRIMGETSKLMSPGYKYMSVLATKREARTYDQLDLLAQFFVLCTPFDNKPKWQIHEYCRDFVLKRFKKGEVIYTLNQDATHYYVVVEGTCELFRPVSAGGHGTSEENLPGVVTFDTDDGRSTSSPATGGDGADVMLGIANRKLELHGKLSAKDELGNEALRRDGSLYTGHVVATGNEGCAVAVISSDAYHERKKLVSESDTAQKIEFLSKIPLFSNRAMSLLGKLAAAFEAHVYPRGVLVLRQGATRSLDESKVFFIVSGECRVVFADDAFTKKTASSPTAGGGDAQRGQFEDVPPGRSPLRRTASGRKFAGGYSLKDSPFRHTVRHQCSTNIAMLGPGSFFGGVWGNTRPGNNRNGVVQPFSVVTETAVELAEMQHSDFVEAFPLAEQAVLLEASRRQLRTWLRKARDLLTKARPATLSPSSAMADVEVPPATSTSFLTEANLDSTDDDDTDKVELERKQRVARQRGKVRKLKTSELLTRMMNVMGDGPIEQTRELSEEKSVAEYLQEVEQEGDTVPQLSGSLAQRTVRKRESTASGKKSGLKAARPLNRLHSTPIMPRPKPVVVEVDSLARSLHQRTIHVSVTPDDSASLLGIANPSPSPAGLLGTPGGDVRRTVSHDPGAVMSDTAKKLFPYPSPSGSTAPTSGDETPVSRKSSGAVSRRSGSSGEQPLSPSQMIGTRRPRERGHAEAPSPGDSDYQAMGRVDGRIAQLRARLGRNRGKSS